MVLLHSQFVDAKEAIDVHNIQELGPAARLLLWGEDAHVENVQLVAFVEAGAQTAVVGHGAMGPRDLIGFDPVAVGGQCHAGDAAQLLLVRLAVHRAGVHSHGLSLLDADVAADVVQLLHGAAVVHRLLEVGSGNGAEQYCMETLLVRA